MRLAGASAVGTWRLRLDADQEGRSEMARTARELLRRRAAGEVEVQVPVGTDLRGQAAEDMGGLIAALRQDAPVRIDLSDCARFDVVALLHVLAVVSERTSRGLITTFKLPHDSAARDFLRKKSFPSAVNYLTGTPFRFLVDDQDGRYFGESVAGQKESQTDPSTAIIDYLSNKRFFSFRPYGIRSGADRSIVIEAEWDHWRNPLMKRFLESRTDGDPSDFTRVVVREMLGSLLRNVSIGTVITGSQITVEEGARCLTVAAWQGAAASAVNLCAHFYRHAVERSSTDGGLFEIDDLVPTECLLESPFSSAEATDGEPTVPLPDSTQPSLDHSLQALYQSVTNVFDGRLECWSGSLFTAIAKWTGENAAARYRLVVVPVADLRLPGNIIAVRIPLGHV